MANSLNDELKNVRINGVWQVLKKIGSGAFGEVFTAINSETNELAAVKFEESNRIQEIAMESKIMKNLQGAIGIPNILWYGSDPNIHKYMIMILD